MKGKKEILIGFVALVAVVGLIIGMFYLKGINVFGESRSFHTSYDDVSGVVPGSSTVTLRGLKIGTVTTVKLNPEDLNTNIVEFIIEDKRINIPVDSKAMLLTDLLSNKTISIELGESTTFTQDGGYINSNQQKDIMGLVDERLRPLQIKTEQLLSTVDSTITVVRDIVGDNSENLNQSFIGLKKSIANFNNMTNELNSLVVDQKGKISSIFSNVNSITANLKASNDKITGILTNVKVLTDSLRETEIKSTVEQAKLAMEGVNDVLASINNENGSLHKLMNDPELYNNVAEMVAQADELVENIMAHPNRYLQFAVFGSKEKGFKLTKKQEEKLRKFINDSL